MNKIQLFSIPFAIPNTTFVVNGNGAYYLYILAHDFRCLSATCIAHHVVLTDFLGDDEMRDDGEVMI